MRTYSCFFGLIVSIFVFSKLATAASFDCSKAATPIEHMICDTAEISDLDSELAEALKGAISSSADATTLRAEQRAWMRGTRNVCSTPACLVDSYSTRIEALKGTPPSQPQVAVASNAAVSAQARGSRSFDDDFGYKAIKFGMTYSDIAKLGVCDIDLQAQEDATRKETTRKAVLRMRDLATALESYRLDEEKYRSCEGSACDAFAGPPYDGKPSSVRMEALAISKDRFIARAWSDSPPSDFVYWDSASGGLLSEGSSLSSEFPPIPEAPPDDQSARLNDRTFASETCYDIGGKRRGFTLRFEEKSHRLESMDIGLDDFSNELFERYDSALGEKYPRFATVSDADRRVFNLGGKRIVCNLFREGSVALCVFRNPLTPAAPPSIQLTYVSPPRLEGFLSGIGFQGNIKPKAEDF